MQRTGGQEWEMVRLRIRRNLTACRLVSRDWLFSTPFGNFFFSLLTPYLVLTQKHFIPSHEIFRHMHKSLNID
jgi:hypothetical protein